MKTKSAFALASVLTLTLVGCVGDAEDAGAGDAEDEDTSETDTTGGETNGGDADGGEEGGIAPSTIDLETLGDDPLILGLVPAQEADTMVDDAEVLGDQLSEQLGGHPVETFVADDYTGLVVAMQTGQAHIGMFGPIVLMQAEEEAGAVPVLQSIRRGVDTYVTQWFTNDPDTYCLDEPVEVEYESEEDGALEGETVTMLFCNGTDSADGGPVGAEALELIEDGTTISFVQPGSASGYYYPATQLLELGVEDFDGQFAGGHPQSVQNVYNGSISIGTSFDDARRNLVNEDGIADVGEEVVVFAWSENIPNDGIAVSGDFTDEEVEAITEAFLAMAGDGELSAGDPLYDVYEIEGLVPADTGALEDARTVYHNFGDE
ncbi:PhnD/SsuA/transferrin family substrate-binding protein [Nesterenkonia flava]